MKAIVVHHYGGPEVLTLEERAIPHVADDEVLIKVAAVGINRPDIMQRQGKYPAPAGAVPDILGLELAGEVVACGSAVNKYKVGDYVCALVSGGAYAEYVVAKEGSCLNIPKGLNFIEAASLPETVFTVWYNLFILGKLKAGEKVLIHGGSSGIGVMAIQLAKAFGCKIIVTAGSKEKCDACLALGADMAINYKEQDFEFLLKETGVNVVLDMVGGNYLPKNINILSLEGRLVYINAMQNRIGELDILKVMQKRLQITGSTLRAREPEFKAFLAREIEKYVWPLFEDKKVKPVIHQVFAYADVIKAHQLMESSRHIGKIMLKF
ncbi:NAD(P)H-quinone oxidoreductase [Pedobacter puniceum]|uniref:Zinc-binding dehydrogenase n=1 Tax=Pedobacter puniceum TaxID=2666136 RepID=A0A7K0FNZ4_9SPHI|nr:NAD(P)H-quinone oxidoreductase [Pedobacter puniceum]MRX47718.1 zinc-binding dehydrogenase [Pedobacter puniceum]